MAGDLETGTDALDRRQCGARPQWRPRRGKARRRLRASRRLTCPVQTGGGRVLGDEESGDADQEQGEELAEPLDCAASTLVFPVGVTLGEHRIHRLHDRHALVQRHEGALEEPFA